MDFWNVPKIMEDHGGPAGLHQQLLNAGHDVKLHTVQSWANRQSIPKDWLATILNIQPDGTSIKPWIMEDIF